MKPGVPIPVTDDPDTAGFFEAAARGSLAVSECGRCRRVLHLPVPYCSACGGWDVAWRDVSPTGKVYSFTVVEQSVHPAFAAPYSVVLIELDEAPEARLVGHLEGRPPLEIGTPMAAEFEMASPDIYVPRWLPMTL